MGRVSPAQLIKEVMHFYHTKFVTSKGGVSICIINKAI